MNDTLLVVLSLLVLGLTTALMCVYIQKSADELREQSERQKRAHKERTKQ